MPKLAAKRVGGRPRRSKHEAVEDMNIRLYPRQAQWLRDSFKARRKAGPHADISDAMRALLAFAMSIRIPSDARTSESALTDWFTSSEVLRDPKTTAKASQRPKEKILQAIVERRYIESFGTPASSDADRWLIGRLFQTFQRKLFTAKSPLEILKAHRVDARLWEQLLRTFLRRTRQRDTPAPTWTDFAALGRQLHQSSAASAAGSELVGRVRAHLFASSARKRSWAVVRWVYVNGLSENDLSEIVGVPASKLKWYLGYETARYPKSEVRYPVWEALQEGWGLCHDDALRGSEDPSVRHSRRDALTVPVGVDDGR